MKKLVFVGAIAFLASCGGSEKGHGSIPESDVPAAVKTAFTAKYPGTAVEKWERESEDGKTLYEAEFKMNGKDMEAFWDEAGNFVKEEAE